MSSDHFYLFTALATFSSPVQEKLRQVQSPEEIVAVAAENGYQITVPQLSFFSKRLNGDHWVWARKGDDWRESFFAAAERSNLQAV
ncbi:Nif11-like leader peptide family natural product precursor [Vulcanococcus limneticus]|uniref:Nif11-like leader peptide family natural product precursor n=1 Tax=Vulcanococcus limneticus TaxID=2170428 RepID=UPI000B990D6E|nr:Nif11-like leader peptide family natural product precursor [Vulcanococcus limneticus]MCP9791926.1 Nif11-like leader peptide family natural product precursor [Vulcanococcus limneticus MW73D5]MCP9893223.1 Nif11-like leader peptide family natural product precursor [Vulcanococcus limneticus Candia 3F8]MCP9897366.1 Nif11-like leader peptide family natural product precursor [Vulcanococcus limneticus Candia 3B3]